MIYEDLHCNVGANSLHSVSTLQDPLLNSVLRQGKLFNVM